MKTYLPPIDLPFHLQEPNSCRRCAHSFYAASDAEQQHLRCGLGGLGTMCVYERHETGSCGPAALHFKPRETV